MKKRPGFYSSLGLLILLNAVIKPVWIFAIDRQVQNAVGVEAYGVYFSLFNLSVVFSFLTDLGFTVFINQQLSAEGKGIIHLTGRFLFLKLSLLVCYSGIVLLAAWVSGITRYDLLLSIILVQALLSLFVFFRSVITSQQWFSTDAWLSVTDKALMILSCGFLLYFPSLCGPVTIERFLFLQVVCISIAILLALWLLFKKGIRFPFSGRWLPGKILLAQVVPFGATVLFMSLHARADAFLLERIHVNGPYEAGIYAGAYRLLDASNMAGYLLISFMLPFIARCWSKKEDITSVVFYSRHFLFMLMTGIIVTVIFLAPWLQDTLYHHKDAYAAEVLRWCLPALAGYALVHIYGTVLTATGHIVQFCYINLFFSVINIVLNLLLIPGYGAMGCCIAALVTQSLCGITAMLYVKQKPGIPLQWRSLFIYIFTGLLLSGFYYVCKDWPVGKWLLITVAVMITIAVMLATRLAGISLLITSWKKNNA